jgi:hypothetical protein
VDSWQRAFDLAETQLGLLHVKQATAAGIPSSTVYEQARRRGWEQPQRRVLALPGMGWAWDREVAAAVLSVSPRALVSRRSAAHLLGVLEPPPRPLEIVVPWDRRPQAPAGALIWRTTTLLRSDSALARGIPATAAARTLCDLASVVSLDELVELIATAIQRRLVNLDGIGKRAAQMGRFHGAESLRGALDALRGSPTDSAAERLLLGALTTAGVPPDATLHPVHDRSGRLLAVLDMAYLCEQVDVEVNGYRFRSTPAHQLRDEERRALLQELGWLIVPVPATLVVRDIGAAVARVRSALDRQRARSGA